MYATYESSPGLVRTDVQRVICRRVSHVCLQFVREFWIRGGLSDTRPSSSSFGELRCEEILDSLFIPGRTWIRIRVFKAVHGPLSLSNFHLTTLRQFEGHQVACNRGYTLQYLVFLHPHHLSFRASNDHCKSRSTLGKSSQPFTHFIPSNIRSHPKPPQHPFQASSSLLSRAISRALPSTSYPSHHTHYH